MIFTFCYFSQRVLVRILFLSHDKYTGGYSIEIGASLALGYISSSTSIDALILAFVKPDASP
jgi:hypothetical protein